MKYIFILKVVALASVCYAQSALGSVSQPWMDTNLTPEQRARSAVMHMTPEEKKGMLYGYGCQSKEWPYVGNVAGIPRLNIPPLKYNDGPQGFRDDAIPGAALLGPLDSQLLQAGIKTRYSHGEKEWGKNSTSRCKRATWAWGMCCTCSKEW